MSQELDTKGVAEAINPYEAAETVAQELVKEGFAKEKPFKTYEITPFGRENKNYYKDSWAETEKKVFEHKMDRIQSWVNTILAVAGFVISIIALCK